MSPEPRPDPAPLEDLPEKLSTGDDAEAVKGGALPDIVTTPIPTGPVPLPYPTSRQAR